MRTLRRVSAELWEPYHVLMAPVYVYLPKNGKFVAVKLPLQYFSEAELLKFKPYKDFYLPDFVDQITPFQKAGESIRTLLINLRQRWPVKTSEGAGSVIVLMPQHEIDDAVLKLLQPLWTHPAAGAAGKNVRIEPFFLCFLANEVCLPFPPERLRSALERDSVLFELALLRSSVAVFLALHVGYADARLLASIRDRVFDATMGSAGSGAPARRQGGYEDPASLLERLVSEAVRDPEEREISASRLASILNGGGTGGTLARKLLSRLEHVSETSSGASDSASLFGEEGICDG